MKLLCTSLAALAIASAAPAAAQNAAPAAATADAAYPMTPQGAADWVAMVEKDMFEFSVEYKLEILQGIGFCCFLKLFIIGSLNLQLIKEKLIRFCKICPKTIIQDFY